VILGAGDEVSAGTVGDPRPVLIVTGLVQEARIAAGPGLTVICSSSDPRQLRSLLAGFDPLSVRGVISFGVAGGLDPALNSGDVVVATEVMAGDNSRWHAASALSEELIAGAGFGRSGIGRSSVGRQRLIHGRLAGVEQVVTAQAGKAALRLRTGAAAVDMESHIAAAYAADAKLPFAALRVISDPATRALPTLATSAIKANGDIDMRKILRGVARNPLSIRALYETGRDFNRALRSLRGCRGFLLGGESFVPADL
jgi:adenosylhomocysteine nucleosidase